MSPQLLLLLAIPATFLFIVAVTIAARALAEGMSQVEDARTAGLTINIQLEEEPKQKTVLDAREHFGTSTDEVEIEDEGFAFDAPLEGYADGLDNPAHINNLLSVHANLLDHPDSDSTTRRKIRRRIDALLDRLNTIPPTEDGEHDTARPG